MINDRYIIECTCINKDNDFGMNVGDVLYYNRKAQTYRYLTKKWSRVEWNYNGTYMVKEGEDNLNPYSDSYWDYTVPVTPKIDNANIYKRLGETERVVDAIEKIGDFSCRIMVLKTQIVPLEND